MSFFHASGQSEKRIRELIYKSAAILGVAFSIVGHAQAANVAFWSDEYLISSFPTLTAAHTATQVTTADIDSGSLQNYDVLVMGHVNIAGPTAATCTQLSSFLAAGNGIVSEWNTATLLFQPAAGAYYAMDNPCNLFAGTASSGSADFGSNIPIQITDSASPLIAGLANPFAMGQGSEFVYQLTSLGPEWNVAATFDGGGVTYPAVLSTAPVSGGCVALSPFDYFDATYEGGISQSNMETLLGNMVNWAARGAAGCGKIVPIPPVLSDDAKTVSRTQPSLIDVLANDEAGVTLDTTYSLVLSDAAAGALSYSGSQIQFTPTNSFTAPVTFQYQACNAQSLCAIATVTLTPEAVIVPATPTPVPALGIWGLLGLSPAVALAGLMGFSRRRR